MVKITSLATALALTLSVAFAHGPHSLEKRAAATCSTVYMAVAAGAYPALDCTPFVQDPQVQTWLKLVDMTKVPVFPQSKDGVCPADKTTIPADQCWWTCQKCEAPTDITSCPKTGTWGLTYDDGPSPDSPRLYDNLLAHNQKATLFIVGSRAISFPETLKRAYKEGHHIAIHTWSHSSMTSLSNQQIVAELKWTEKAIFDTIGVTPIYWRPPYGDIDNRVRAIATQLGYKTSIWTQDFDTNDWNIPAKTATPQSVVDTFKTWLTKIPTMKTGFIVLEHDLLPEEVDVSVNGILPVAYTTKNLVMQPIPQCLGDGKPYLEGAGTFKLIADASNSTTGSNAGSNGSAAKNVAVAVSASVVVTSAAGMAAVAIVAMLSSGTDTSLYGGSPYKGRSILEKRAPTTTGPQAPQQSACTAKIYTTPIAAGNYPTLDCIPFVQDPQVQEWLKLVDMTKVPMYPLSSDGVCPPDPSTIPAGQCWWTCQKCEAPTDVTKCPTTGTWASPTMTAHHPILLGSTLLRAYKEGHQIAIHTWSHPSMTSLSNEQIVAELKWTEKVIFDTIGVTPIYWCPPYGDIDNRVRAIATQLGYKTIIWTQDFDTDDWNIAAGTATPQSVVDTFKTWLTKIPTMSTGFIVLEHDLLPQTVDVALTGILHLPGWQHYYSSCLGNGDWNKDGYCHRNCYFDSNSLP
ncbi:chitin deacetylase [Mortierella sp. NVP41]|nr:chitin deacetylase [Mortierella sp. NVP41]